MEARRRSSKDDGPSIAPDDITSQDEASIPHAAAPTDTKKLSSHNALATELQDQSNLGDSENSASDTNLNSKTEESPFPQLSNDASVSPKKPGTQSRFVEQDEEAKVPEPFPRSASPVSTQRQKGASYEKIGEEGVCRMHRFWLYETASRFYLVGGDILEHKFRILKIDRTADMNSLSIAEDDIVYTKKETNQLLDAVDDGNKASGGMKLKYTFSGLLGFVRFTGPYYMLLITKKSHVAVIGGHYIYQIDGTELVPLCTSTSRSKVDRDSEEARFVSILNNVDLTRSFYFSYSYDISRTLQHNIARERQVLQQNTSNDSHQAYNDMFIWNHYLLEPALSVMKNVYDWCLPIIHGFVDQASNCVCLPDVRAVLIMDIEIPNYGRSIYITVIARRSRFFAGARFLKRGVNDLVGEFRLHFYMSV